MDQSLNKPPWLDIKFQKGNLIDLSFLFADFGEWRYDKGDDEIVLDDLRNRIKYYETDNNCQWEYYKKVVNPYELVYTQKKYEIFPESVCLLRPLSRSYFKMCEILHITRFFDDMKKNEKLRSAHVCEGPGGFIEALYDITSKQRMNITQTTAMTLRPKQPNVPGWKRAHNFLLKNQTIKILYGDDNTGDIMKVANQDTFISNCVQKVNIFTADGGFDFSTDYSSQERLIFPLQIASVRIGFEVLKEGGIFVLKFFDTYYDGMKDLLYFLSCHFRTWTLYKPATSRPCNPERYFIGKGYRGCNSKVLSFLQSWCILIELGMIPRRLFRQSLPIDFSEYMCMENGTCVTTQILYLKRVFQLIENSSEELIKKFLRKHEIISYDWCRFFNVPVYPGRFRSIEALRNDQRDVDLQ